MSFEPMLLNVIKPQLQMHTQPFCEPGARDTTRENASGENVEFTVENREALTPCVTFVKPLPPCKNMSTEPTTFCHSPLQCLAFSVATSVQIVEPADELERPRNRRTPRNLSEVGLLAFLASSVVQIYNCLSYSRARA